MNYEKICDICHSVSERMCSAKSYDTVLKVNLGFKGTKLNKICLWCKSVLQKLLKFIKMVENSYKLDNKAIEIKKVFNLSIHKNDYIDINPFNEVFLEEIYQENVENSNSIENMREEINYNCVEKVKYKELKFNVKYLSEQEQKEEIKHKILSEKCLKMPFKCEKCGISFLTQDVFEEHDKRHDTAFGKYTCKICDLKFKSPTVLSQHVLSHSRQFVCTVCNSIFKRWSRAKGHRLKCDLINDTAVCKLCKKIFDNKHSLEAHIKGVHEINKKYICNYCNMKFSTNQRLTVHKRCHTGQKPFICDICNKKFTTNSNLKCHKSVHLSTRAYYCVECDTHYKSKKSLQKHYLEAKRHIMDCERKYPCTICSKKFLTEKSLSSHIKIRHLTDYECDICKKKLSSKSNLTKHIRCVHGSKD